MRQGCASNGAPFGAVAVVSFAVLLARMRALLGLLRQRLEMPVDIEFACDGQDLYLVQCRAQSFVADAAPAAIPHDLSSTQLLFSTQRFVSNGRVPDLTHVVYVDAEGYHALASRQELLDVGRAVGRLNAILPARRFALIGPGRWGSRGDIKLGVQVTYADISNTSLLMEVAARRGAYVPELSFGTHFFQDLVEAGIRYLPLFPDERDVVFNDAFLRDAPNALAELLPEYAHLASALRIIDVPRATGGLILRVLMNADAGKAVGLFATP